MCLGPRPVDLAEDSGLADPARDRLRFAIESWILCGLLERCLRVVECRHPAPGKEQTSTECQRERRDGMSKSTVEDVKMFIMYMKEVDVKHTNGLPPDGMSQSLDGRQCILLNDCKLRCL